MPVQSEAWRSLRLIEPIDEGNRNEVWRARLDDVALDVSVRRSRRSVASLDWELDLIERLDELGFMVPVPIRTDDGRRRDGDLVVQRWLHGRAPSTDGDWHRVAEELGRLHDATRSFRQRPGCSATPDLTRTSCSVDADMRVVPADVAEVTLSVFASFVDHPRSVLHGDPTASNLRLDADGRVGLLDFDESRVDVAAHDLSNLGVQVLDDDAHRRAERLSNAWEAVNGWLVEREYARERYRSIR